ncbi:MAG: regulatory protein SipA [Leptolyngbyaceae cyanobacterium]
MSITFLVGDRVRLATAPPYLKTADTMPMLRPGDLVPVKTVGTVVAQKPSNYWVVKFEQGSFLVDGAYLEPVGAEPQTLVADTSQSG